MGMLTLFICLLCSVRFIFKKTFLNEFETVVFKKTGRLYKSWFRFCGAYLHGCGLVQFTGVLNLLNFEVFDCSKLRLLFSVCSVARFENEAWKWTRDWARDLGVHTRARMILALVPRHIQKCSHSKRQNGALPSFLGVLGVLGDNPTIKKLYRLCVRWLCMCVCVCTRDRTFEIWYSNIKRIALGTFCFECRQIETHRLAKSHTFDDQLSLNSIVQRMRTRASDRE